MAVKLQLGNEQKPNYSTTSPLFSCRHAPRGDRKIYYTTAIGQDLWIVAASHAFDPTTLKPSLSIQIKAAHPVILWTKGKASAIEIWVDRNDGNGFVFLIINTEPNTHHPATRPRH